VPHRDLKKTNPHRKSEGLSYFGNDPIQYSATGTADFPELKTEFLQGRVDVGWLLLSLSL